jgi:hypothetical protein
MRPGSLARLDVLAPLALVVALVADVAARLLPRELFTFRAWEALRVVGEPGPFRPNRRYENPAAYGDLANLANLPRLREYRLEIVTTDELGFRNAPGLAASGAVAALLTGTSFAAGTEVGDDEHLAAQLTRLTGMGVYNAALAEWDFETLRGLRRRTGGSAGALIFEYLEARGAPSILVTSERTRAARCPDLLADRPAGCRAYAWVADRARVSPVRVITRRLLRRVQDDRWLPNPDRGVVHRGRLPDGRDILFEATDLEWSLPAAEEARIVRYFSWLERRLAREGIALLVVLTPKKYTVYGPLAGASPGDPDAGAHSLARIAAGLGARGVAAVDLTPVLRAAAAAALEHGRTVYFLDDTHWNAAGIAAAARAIAPRLSPP